MLIFNFIKHYLNAFYSLQNKRYLAQKDSNSDIVFCVESHANDLSEDMKKSLAPNKRQIKD